MASKHTRLSNLITIVCTAAGLTPVFLHGKLVPSAILLGFGIVSILYARVDGRPFSRKLALGLGCFLVVEGAAIALYGGFDSAPARASITDGSPALRATFNETQERHYPVVQVSSFAADPGCSTCWKPSVEAKPGDLVAFNILVVNTAWGGAIDAGVVARNVTVNFATEQVGRGLMATAKVSAENAAPLASVAQVHVSNAYRDVKFSALWEALGYRYENAVLVRTESPGAPPTLYLGDVRPGWPSQRVIVLQYRVEGTPIAPRSGCLPLRAETLRVGVVTPNWAELRGIGRTADTTRSWFDFGVTASFGWSVEDAGGVGTVRVLQPKTTYYYRYVVQNECGWTAWGETGSFTTPELVDHDYYPTPPVTNR